MMFPIDRDIMLVLISLLALAGVIEIRIMAGLLYKTKAKLDRNGDIMIRLLEKLGDKPPDGEVWKAKEPPEEHG